MLFCYEYLVPTEAVQRSRERGYRYKIRSTRAKLMQLTQRDVELLQAIHKYRVLHRGQISDLFFAGVNDEGSSARRRLNLLYQHGYLERIPRFISPPINNPGPAYRLAQRGAVLLAERSNVPPSEFNYWGKSEDKDSHIGHVGHAYLEHSLTLADIRLWFEQQVVKVGCHVGMWLDDFDLRASWKTERVHVQLTPQTGLEDVAIAPDGYFTLETPKGRGHFFLEFDRGTETIGKQWKRKLLAYQEYLRSGKFHQQYHVDEHTGFRVLTIATSMKRAANLHAAAKTYADATRTSMFLFSDWTVLQQRTFKDALWSRGNLHQFQALIEL